MESRRPTTPPSSPRGWRPRSGSSPAILILALALMTAACGGGGEREVGRPSEPERTITHAMGETKVPARPKRVVVLDTQELDAAFSLGIKPVGAVRTDVATDLPSYLRAKVEGITQVGTIQSPNLEAIASLQPDLILSSKLRHEDIYEELSQIAPTVFAERTGDAWKESFVLYARALGMEEKAKELLAAYQKRAEEIGGKLGDPSELTVSIVRFLPDEIRLYGPKSFSGTVLSDVGVARPEVVLATEKIAVDISLEQLPQADADVVYVTTYGSQESTQRSQAEPLLANLEATKNGKLYPVDDDIWMLAIGVTGANLLLDDLEETLVG